VAILAAAGLALLVATAGGSAGVRATEEALFKGQVTTITVGCTPIANSTGTISWGDGTRRSAAHFRASGARLQISGKHQYAEEGLYGGSVTGSYRCNGDYVPFSTRFAVNVADAALRLGRTSLLPVAGRDFRGPVAILTDGDPAGAPGDYRAIINWGDGDIQRASVRARAGRLTVNGSHTYRAVGIHRLSVRVHDRGGSDRFRSEYVLVRSLHPPRHGPHVGGPKTAGDGTAILPVDLDRAGVLTVRELGRGQGHVHSIRLRVRHAQSLPLILNPTSDARSLLRGKHELRFRVEINFYPFGGGSFHWIYPIILNYRWCSGSGGYFTFNGTEQSCVVPANTTQVQIKAIGAAGGFGGLNSYGYPTFPGQEGGPGLGAFVLTNGVSVQPYQTLYVEVGGQGSSGYFGGVWGSGGWNGGGNGQLPAFSWNTGSGGGGGATDVRLISCIHYCGQGGGFGTLISLGSRIVVAAGGGGGGTGGDAEGGTTKGGDGGTEAAAGQSATVSGAGAITGLGGGAGTANSPGRGGSDSSNEGCNEGHNGNIGIGGAGGVDNVYFPDEFDIGDFAGGGGGGGLTGGGGGGGGCASQEGTIGGGGGGGGGSSLAASGSTIEVNEANDPASVQITPLAVCGPPCCG
jgi:hypothetical protein